MTMKAVMAIHFSSLKTSFTKSAITGIFFLWLAESVIARNIKIGLLIPRNLQTSTGLSVESYLERARNIGVTVLPIGYNLSFIWGCNICDEQDAMVSAIKLYQHDQVDVFIAPRSEKASDSVYLLTSYWKIPLLSWIPMNHVTLDSQIISMAPRISDDFLQALEKLFIHFQWSKLSVIYDASCQVMVNHLEAYSWNHISPPCYHAVDVSSTENITKALLEAKDTATGILLCLPPDQLQKIFRLSELYGMMDGKYVFLYFNTALSLTRLQPTLPRKFMVPLLQIVDTMVQENEYAQFTTKYTAVSKGNIRLDIVENFDSLLPYVYDTVILWSVFIHHQVRNGKNSFTEEELKTFVQKLNSNNTMFLTSPVQFDVLGNRQSRFSVIHEQNKGSEVIGVVTRDMYRQIKPISDWPSISLPTESSNHPDATGAIIGAVIGVILTVIVIVVILYIYKKYRAETTSTRLWSVNGPELKMKRERITKIKPDMASVSTHNNNNDLVPKPRRLTRMETRATLGSTFSLDKNHLFAPIGQYRGSIVAIKALHGRSIKLTTDMIEDLNIIKELEHDNLNVFVGAKLNNSTGFILYKYCAKGSLHDVLENDDIKLDWMFKMSFAIDIAKGMEYLHKCPLKSNGNLKSNNCVIDSRWVVKITDFGALSTTDTIHATNQQDYYEKLLWTSPELLRLNKRPKKGSQKGDVFSYAVILYEIFLRCTPYFYNNTTTKDVIYKLRVKMESPYRPEIPTDQGLVGDALTLMISCWDEDPQLRPDFRSIRKLLIELNGGRKMNIMDNMIKLLEAYSGNLEKLVADRTEEVAQEKAKTERLLYQMLPQAVADQLKLGNPVIPESFEEVSIFFSDIVGFTTIAGISQPLQVVDLLNDLYTTFDGIIAKHDVYKVETIGDAYMCVSGVPNPNGKRHSAEIANMALDLINAVHNFRIRHLPDEKLLLRVGLHTGSCAAGVVGQIMPRYCLFGDTVNMASRMESMGKALHIHMSSAMNTVLNALDEGFLTVQRGNVQIKGKGLQKTYWLVGKKLYKKTLPDSMLRFHVQEESPESRPTTPSVKSIGFDDSMYTGLLRKPSIATNPSSTSLNSMISMSDSRSDVINNELLSVDEQFRFEYHHGECSLDDTDMAEEGLTLNVPRIELTDMT